MTTACSATSRAHALTNASWPVANARATVSTTKAATTALTTTEMPPTAKDLTIATQLLTATVATTPRASAVQIPAVTTTTKRTTITVPTPTTNNEIDIIAAFRATCKGSLTRELKTALTKVAFQQWRIVTQDTAIQEAKLKIMQETPVAAIPTAPLLSESSATTITCTIPAPIPT
jgi:hypothetical protein